MSDVFFSGAKECARRCAEPEASDNVFGSYFFYMLYFSLSFKLNTKRPMLLERGRIEHGLQASVLNFKK